MSESIAHRGPDEIGAFADDRVALGFRRLSILDLSPNGHQPMHSEDGHFVIVYNGEIYNYVELRAELEALGHRFRSTGDTEVLLKAYAQWGSACLERLNGMFAFVVYDRRRKTVLGARDRFGIKPFFMHRAGDNLLLASEIKAIRASGLYRPTPDLQTVSRFLIDGALDENDRTFFTGIERLPPGGAFELAADGRLRQWRYWTLQPSPHESVDPARDFAELFEDAVRLHMRSDVPVAVHLSGGLDSTSIICASARIRRREQAQGPLLAFSFMSREFDERAYIADTIAQTNAQMIELSTSPLDLWHDLPRMLYFQDEPVHSMTAIVGFQLMRVTAENGIRVVLNGQGADETIAGYGNYFSNYWYSLARQGRFAQSWREIGRYAEVHKSASQGSLFARHLNFCLRSFAGQFDAYRRLAAKRQGSSLVEGRGFSRELIAAHGDHATTGRPADLNSVLVDSVVRAPLPLYLRVEDRNSMAHSVEGRVPFLDHRLVELLFSMAPEWKMRGPWNKHVLREAMRGRIPESVRTRPDKMGFPTPMASWFRDALFEPVMDTLGSRAARERGLYDTALLRQRLERHRAGDGDFAGGIFDVVETEMWFQQQIDSFQAPPPAQAAAPGSIATSPVAA